MDKNAAVPHLSTVVTQCIDISNKSALSVEIYMIEWVDPYREDSVYLPPCLCAYKHVSKCSLCIYMHACIHTHTCLPLCSIPRPFVVLIQFQCLTNFSLHNLQDVFSITRGSSSASNLPLLCITKLELSGNYCKKRPVLFSVLCSLLLQKSYIIVVTPWRFFSFDL